jgi:hypothetical protein
MSDIEGHLQMKAATAATAPTKVMAVNLAKKPST